MAWQYEPRDPAKRAVCHCPLCGYDLGGEYHYLDLKQGYEICDCCGCEYGYTDTRAHREAWLAGGAKWRNPKARPADWSLDEQLKNANPDWWRYTPAELP
jgi:hypothetical protein